MPRSAELVFSSDLLKQSFPSNPGFVASLFVRVCHCLGFRGRRINGRVFARPHEPVARAFISHRLVGLACGLHQLLALRDRLVNTRIVAAIESVDGTLYPCDRRGILRSGAIEYERRLEARSICCKAKSLAPAIAEPGHCNFPVARRELGYIVSNCVQVAGNLIGRQVTNCLADSAAIELA